MVSVVDEIIILMLVLHHWNRVPLDGHSILLFEERMVNTLQQLERLERTMESRESLEILCMMLSLFASFTSRSRKIIREGKQYLHIVKVSQS